MNTDDSGRADLWPNAELVFIRVCGVLGYYAHAEKTRGKDMRLEATEHPNHRLLVREQKFQFKML